MTQLQAYPFAPPSVLLPEAFGLLYQLQGLGGSVVAFDGRFRSLLERLVRPWPRFANIRGVAAALANHLGNRSIRMRQQVTEFLLRFGAHGRPNLTSQIRFFSSCMLSASPRISLVNTSKLAGVPASSVF